MSREVVAAAIFRDGLLLAAQRDYPTELAGRWELPGGKVEPGESDVEALARECLEELGVAVTVGEQVGPEVVPIGPGLTMRTYLATIDSGDQPQANSHRELRWLARAQLNSVQWLEADLPIIDALRELVGVEP